MTTFLLIRHCSATGQEPSAPLSPAGKSQAIKLAETLKEFPITCIFSSPYTRAIATITPFAQEQLINVEQDDRLMERVLSSENLPDWMEKLEMSFQDSQISFEGGESGDTATSRIVAVFNELATGPDDCIAIVSHGNLIALLLGHISNEFGFKDWKSMRNPEVFEVEWTGETRGFRKLT